MKINAREKSYKTNSVAFDLINYLQNNEKNLSLIDSNLYFDFPVFKDVDGEVLISQVLLVSQKHGILLISVSDNKDANALKNESNIENIEQLHPIIFSRLLRNKNLRRSKTELKFPITSFLFCPNLPTDLDNIEDIDVITNFTRLNTYLDYRRCVTLESILYYELISTLEGAKGIIKAKKRPTLDENKKKGYVAGEIEKEINSFDQYQKKAFMNDIIGPERIRGLAGSGKTVILALKAAIAHLKEPNANIVYTFYTKSLYQHIQRLITRFYRQYDDKDPDWDKLKIMHAWGGQTNSGLYYEAAETHHSYYYNYGEAAKNNKADPFDFACSALLNNTEIKPIYDYIFIDEGQDFPESFLKLCLKLAKNGHMVWAYDELQTIFQIKTPELSQVLDKSIYQGPEEDIILYKCYRNPREILVIAHAIGFGFYGKRIVQMIEDKDYWQDVGYKVIDGDFKQGEKIRIERPKENSLETISKYFATKEIIKYQSCESYSAEIEQTVTNILIDINEGLLPDDILVIVVDDRNAQNYLNDIQQLLAQKKVKSNNIHSDKFNLKDFAISNHVTLSTVHKAKGNEAYSVHIVGIDSLYALDPTIRQRNVMFTAMTRAKGWLSLTGVGNNATLWTKELDLAIKYCPDLQFIYPSSKELKIMKRDIKDNSTRKSRQAKILDDLLSEMSPEEIKQFLVQREIKKKK